MKKGKLLKMLSELHALIRLYLTLGLTGDEISPVPRKIQKRFAVAEIIRGFGISQMPGPGF